MKKRERELRQKRAAALEGATAIVTAAETANRDLTDQEMTDIAAKRAEAANILRQIETLSGLEEEAATLTGHRGVEVHDNHQDEPFRNLGEQMIAVRNSTGHGRTVDPRLLGIMERAAAGASEAVPGDGGWLVQTDFSANLLTRAFQAGQLIQRVQHVTISANANGIKMNALDDASRATGSRGGGLQVYWVAEAGTTTAKKPTFRQIRMDLQKLMGLFYATEELMMDASALSSIAEQGFQKEFAFVFDDSIFRGNGVGQPLGFMNSPALRTISKESGQAADTIVTENVTKMYAALPASSQASAVWLTNVNTFPQLLTLSIGIGAAGYPVFLPPGGISGQPYGTLFGRPVLQIEQAASLGDLGDICLVDLGEYLWIEKGGIQAASSIHLQFLSDETTFRWVVRVNGQPTWDKPVSPFKGTASSISPFVTLAAR